MKKKSHPLTLRGISMNDKPFSPHSHEAKNFSRAISRMSSVAQE